MPSSKLIALTRTEAANNSVSVRTQLAEGLPRVQGDRVQLQQVLVNLIIKCHRSDARRRRRGSGNCSSAPVTNRMAVSVEVRDSGPGFAPETLEHVFEAFYTTKPGGLGMGLSICRSIIEAHGGRLWANANLPAAPAFNSPCRRSQTLRRDAALVSRPNEQATRPRVLLWVNRVASLWPYTGHFRSCPISGHSQSRSHVSKVPGGDIARATRNSNLESNEALQY